MSTFQKDKNISIIGVGRLGLAAALVYEKKGYNILGVDVFSTYCDTLNSRNLESPEPYVTEYLKAAKNFRATTNIDEALAFSNLIFILVDTPTGVAEKSYDYTKLSRVLMQINDRKVKDKHLVIACTVLPGFADTVARFLIKDCVNTTINYNPEFIAQGSIIKNFENPDMVLIGEGSKESGDVLESLYRSIVSNNPVVCRMTAVSAEITKISINCFITTKIAYCNYIGDIAAKTPGADKDQILGAIGHDSRIGTKCLKPGYGFGGPCFPRDNRALGWYSKSIGIEPLLPEATDRLNKQHCQFMINEFLQQNKDLYVFEDVCYKDGCAVPIIEESQKITVARGLLSAGKKVLIRDREVVVKEVMKEWGNIFQYEVIKQ